VLNGVYEDAGYLAQLRESIYFKGGGERWRKHQMHPSSKAKDTEGGRMLSPLTMPKKRKRGGQFSGEKQKPKEHSRFRLRGHIVGGGGEKRSDICNRGEGAIAGKRSVNVRAPADSGTGTGKVSLVDGVPEKRDTAEKIQRERVERLGGRSAGERSSSSTGECPGQVGKKDQVAGQ